VNRIISGTLAGACVLLAGCSSPPAGHIAGSASSAAARPGESTYLCPGIAGGELLEWREHDGDLRGTFHYMWLSGQAPSEGITSLSGDLTGTLRGTAITLHAGFSHPLRASLKGGLFSLNIPDPDGATETVTCRRASMADWNKEVAALNNKLNADNNLPASQARA